MKAGSTMTSRDSQDVRHMRTARQPRAGRPRWKLEATSAINNMATASASESDRKPVLIGRPASSASASVTTKPCAAPASVVNSTTDQAGFMRSRSPPA